MDREEFIMDKVESLYDELESLLDSCETDSEKTAFLMYDCVHRGSYCKKIKSAIEDQINEAKSDLK
jgi:ElaB/YqjD/DUF883 family membrane-anchored ribosome-binding protein